MTIRPANQCSLHSYPKIHIDRASVIKPCTAEQAAADQFIDKSIPTWKKLFFDVWQEGIPFMLKHIVGLKTPNANIYYVYLVKTIKYLALILLHLHQAYLRIYGYFYPYSLMSLDELCNQFSRCPNWTESVIKAFSWHPSSDRCAVAICNDYVYVYHETNRIRILRHNNQRKITDMAWHPTNEEILIVATQTNLILWKIPKNNPSSKFSDNTPGIAYLAPGVHLIRRNVQTELTSSLTDNSIENNFRLIDNILMPPIISIQFNKSGDKLFACSPNSSKIAILDVDQILSAKPDVKGKIKVTPHFIRRFGQGLTKLMWSPTKNRLAVSTTSSFMRVFEPFSWTCKNWQTQDTIQDFIWSKPMGRILLVANKTEPYLYALPFLDNPTSKDVGGNRLLAKALDLTATVGELGDLIGGRIQSLAWDAEGKRLAISFKDNPQSILLYRTVERPTIEFHQLGIIQSENGSYPLLMEFHEKFKNGSLLTICWSDGHCQHVPLNYALQEISRNGTASLNGSLNGTLNSSNLDSAKTPTGSRPPRSLTNFCHGSSSISPHQGALMPINKLQHQKTLFTVDK